MTLTTMDHVPILRRGSMADFVADVRCRRQEIEDGRRLPAPVLQGLVDAGLARLCVPRRFGGDETDPIGFMAVVEEVARADASTAWCLWIYSSAPWFLSRAADGVADELFADGPDLLIASPLVPKGVATPTAGGYRLSGRWPFASGSQGADWLVCRAVVAGARAGEAGGGPPAMRLMLVPAASVTTVDTWWTSGLCGTGSGDVVVDDVFVPEPHAIDFDGAGSRWPESLYSFPHRGLACVSAAIALGVARDSLDEFIGLAQAKTPTFGSSRLAERSQVQTKVARAEAELGSARAYLHQSVGEAWESVLSTGSVPARLQAMLRAAANHACRAAAGVVDTVYNAAGGTSIYRSSPLQRSFRDIHSVTQHFFHSEDVDEQAGRVLLGVDDLGATRL
ncbi:MAG: indole-3-acetate monooxygenase [Actinomycetota bacterium]|jgi:alkylation response protein AidB-like acyl-CoA dehydrogenase|nr:indole-3-acetate monooxygenase [Actinomycetota bacterium]